MSEVLHRLATKASVEALTQAIEDLPNATQEAADAANAAAENALGNFAKAFDATKAGGYKKDEYVTYTDGKIYRFTADHTGAWDTSHVILVDIGHEIEYLRTLTTEYKGNLPETITDINDVMENSCYFISTPREQEIENWPLGESQAGWLITRTTLGNRLQVIQFALPWLSDQSIWYRICHHGETWLKWFRITADDFDRARISRDQNFGRGASSMLTNTAISFHVDGTNFVSEYELESGMYKTTGTIPSAENSKFVNIISQDHGLCGLIAGKTYHFLVRTETISIDSDLPTVQMFVNFNESGDASWEIAATITNDKVTAYTIPENASGLLFRWRFAPGTYNTYNAFECVQSDMLTPHMVSLFNDEPLPSCDLNDVTKGNHFYLLYDSQEYEHMPLATLTTGFLQVLQSGVWTKQIFYALSDGRSWVRTFQYGSLNTDWVLSGGGGGNTYNITQEISQDTYENTYDITTSPQITTDTNNFLQAVDDETTTEANATDMTGAIMSMLNSTGHCKLGTGTFYVSGNINLPNGATLEGCGNQTIVRLLSSVSSGYIVRLTQYCTVKGIRFSGGKNLPTNLYTDGTNTGSRHGVYMIANADGQEATQTQVLQNIVTDCFFENFDGSAFYAHNTGGGLHNSVIFSDSHIEHCRVGVNLDYYNEYGKYSNLIIFQCYYACINNGGNNIFTGCTFHGVVGWLTDNSGDDKTNNQHGSCVGCTFNHIDNMNHPDVHGNGKAIHIINGSSGFIFTGCQLWYGNVYIENSIGVQFSDCLFGNNAIEIEVTGSYPAFFFNNIFWTTPTLDVLTSCKFEGNYLRTGTVIEP